jgi:hypothetical protein
VTVVTHIGIPADAFELGAVFSGADARIELTQFVSSGGDLVPFFWATNTDDEASFEAAVLDHPAVATLTHLGGIAEKNLYQIEWEDGIDGFLSAIGDNDVIVEGGAGTAEEWVFQLWTHDREALSAFHDDCTGKEIPIDIHRITAAPDSAADTRYDLTRLVSRSERIRLASIPTGISPHSPSRRRRSMERFRLTNP